MTKLILTPTATVALLIAMGAGSAAQANPAAPADPVIANGPFAALIGLLLPAVQKVREAAAR